GRFLGGAAALAVGGRLGLGKLYAQAQQPATTDIAFTNGRIHTMDANNRVVSQVLIRNGRFAGVGDALATQGVRVVNLMGKTVIPGIIDAHNHIVLVGNRPGWHTPLEHTGTIPEAIAELKARSAQVPAGEFITTVDPVAARQFQETRLPHLA